MPKKSGKTPWKGYDDCRPNAEKPRPGKTDCTSEGRTAYGKSQNVSAFADRATTNEGFKGLPDSRPDSNSKTSY